MKRQRSRHAAAALVCLLVTLGGPRVSGEEKTAAGDGGEVSKVTHWLEATGIQRGIGVILAGAERENSERFGRLAVELAQDGAILAHVWAASERIVQAGRKIVDAAGLHGTEAIVERGPLNRLPHADNTVDFVVATDLTDETLSLISAAEIVRALRPHGKALLEGRGKLTAAKLREWCQRQEIGDVSITERAGGLQALITKPRPSGEGDWSHIEHGPDNNPLSDDALIRAPYMTKWLGRPYYIGMPAITVAANGRIFLATGHIAHHKREEQWLNTLMARNGYNGTILWTRKLPDGYLVHRSAFVAKGDTLYMVDTDGSGCLLIDAETGEEKGRIDSPAVRGQWKWMAVEGGVLYALVGGKKDPPETTIVRSKKSHWSWGELSKGYYAGRVPWGFGKKIVACDIKTKKLLWEHAEKSPIDSRGMALGEGRIFHYCPDSHIACLNAKTGKRIWINPDKKVRDLIEEVGRGLTSTPGFRTMTFCLYTPDVLVFQAQTRMNVVALSTRDGYHLWSRKKTTNNPNALLLDEGLVLGIGKQGSSLLVDPATGTTLGDLGFGKRSCARLTGTADSLFCRGMPEGLTRFDRATKEVSYNGAFRPACNDGVVAANGLLYLGPWLCDCNLSLMGRVVMCSAGSFDFRRVPPAADRLTAGSGALDRVTPLAVTSADWETYRGNVARGASTPVPVPLDALKLWEARAKRAFRPTALTTAGGLVFLCGDDGKVRAIHSATGRPSWTYLTAGPILQPPTIWNGRAYVGSGDGYIYCLEARTGRLLWRFRAAPVERRVPIYGKLCSTWPVHSGVLVKDGIAYAAAGIIDYDGTHVYALDAVTGEVKWQNNSSGHLNAKLRKGVSAQGFLTATSRRLFMPGGNVVSPAAYDLGTGRYVGALPADGSPRTNRGEEIGVILDRYLVLGGRLRFSARRNVVNPSYFSGHALTEKGVRGGVQLQRGKITPAWDDRKIVLVPGPSQAPVWFDTRRFELYLNDPKARRRGAVAGAARGHALEGRDTVSVALAANAVLAVAERETPRNLRTRWSVSALDPENGDALWEHALPSAAEPGGLAVDREGRVLVVLEDGGVICFGGEETFTRKIDSLVEAAEQGGDARRRAVEALTGMIRKVRAARSRELIFSKLEKLGVDITAAARQRGSLTRWQLLAPVPWNDAHPVDKQFVGEPNVDPSARVSIGRRQLRWRRHVTVDPNGMVDLAAIYGTLADVAAYAYAEFELGDAQDLSLRIGSNDGFKCWLNGVEVGRHDEGRTYAPDQDIIAVRGKAGANKLLLKVTQMGNQWALGVRVTDRAGRPVAVKQQGP